MKFYGLFTTTRKGDSSGEIYASEADRLAALRAFAEVCLDDEDPNVDRIGAMTSTELFAVVMLDGHDAHFFDGEIDPPSGKIPAPGLTRGVLDDMPCSNPNCVVPDCELVLLPACHPDTPTYTKYNKLTGTATVCCCECGLTCARLSIRA